MLIRSFWAYTENRIGPAYSGQIKEEVGRWIQQKKLRQHSIQRNNRKSKRRNKAKPKESRIEIKINQEIRVRMEKVMYWYQE